MVTGIIFWIFEIFDEYRLGILFSPPSPPYRVLSSLKYYSTQRDGAPHVHGSNIHNSQKVEVTHMSINGWIDK